MAELTAAHHAREVATAVTVRGAALAVVAAFGWLLVDIVRQGAPGLSLRFLLEPPSDAGRAGGILPMIVSTTLIVTTCIVVALPIGVGAALYLADQSARRERTGRFVRRSLDALAAVPSIVFGLFGNVLFCHVLGLGFSILSGGLTLACMVLPILIRTTEAGLRSVPDEYRQAAAALALGRATTSVRIVLPAAMPAVGAGLVLGIGRAVAETAALLFTSGYVDRMPGSLLDSGRAISVHIYEMAMNVPGGNRAAYASALTLVVALVAINACTVALMRRVARRGQR